MPYILVYCCCSLLIAASSLFVIYSVCCVFILTWLCENDVGEITTVRVVWFFLLLIFDCIFFCKEVNDQFHIRFEEDSCFVVYLVRISLKSGIFFLIFVNSYDDMFLYHHIMSIFIVDVSEMSTNHLHATHTSSYQSFFADNSIIVSLPLVMHYTQPSHADSNNIFIMQQLPARLYIGLSFASERWIHRWSYQYFDARIDWFSHSSISAQRSHTDAIQSFIESIMAECNLWHPWLTVNILSDVHSRSGCEHETITWYGILLLTSYACGVMTKEDFMHQTDYDWQPLIAQTSSLFGRDITPIVKAMQTTTDIPTLFSHSRLGQWTHEKRSWYEHPISWWHEPLLHTALISLVHKQSVESYSSTIPSYLDETVALVQADCDSQFYGMLTNKTPYFYQRGESIDFYDGLQEQYQSALLTMMSHVYGDHCTDQWLVDLVRLIRASHYASSLWMQPTGIYEKYLSIIRDHCQLHPSVAYWIDHRYPETVLFVANRDEWVRSLEYLVQTLRKNHLSSLFVTSKQWSKYGIHLEQDTLQGEYSELLPQWSCVVTDHTGKSTIIDYFDALIGLTDWLVIDTVDKKVYVNGVKTSSKQIHSQAATVDILTTMRERQGECVHRDELPTSCYTENRNVITSKIISPFKRLVKSSLDKDISWKCTWPLYNYGLTLEMGDVPYHFIEEL